MNKNEKPVEVESASPAVTSPLRLRPKSPKDKSPHSYSNASSLPMPVSRRQSSSYKHLKQNNLVSRSPFKVASPTTPPTSTATTTKAKFTSSLSPVSRTSPGSAHTHVYNPGAHSRTLTRRTSAEKRPRPQSMQDQAEVENDRPFANKRERRQSKGIKGLVEKEPVSRSLFRRCMAEADVNQLGINGSAPANETAAKEIVNTTTPVNANGSSPSRSSLVSRRLHGPRVSGSAPFTSRRARRKTVTWDERCDVVEFEPEEDEEGDESRDRNVFESDNDDCDGLDGQEHWDDGDYPLPGPEHDQDEPLRATISSLLRSEQKSDDLLHRAQDLLKGFDAVADLPDGPADESILSQTDQDKALPPSEQEHDHAQDIGLTAPQGQTVPEHSEDTRLSLGSFQTSLRLSGMGLGLGLGIGLDLDEHPDADARQADAAEVHTSRSSINIPATDDMSHSSANIKHNLPATKIRRNGLGRGDIPKSGHDAKEGTEGGSDDGNTSYSSCEDVDLSTLLDEAQNGRNKPTMDVPMGGLIEPPAGRSSSPQATTPTAPLLDISLTTPRSPTTARMASPLTPNKHIVSRGTSPRLRVPGSPGAHSGNDVSTGESPAALTSRAVESPTMGLRVRPRIDRERVRRRLRDRAGQMITGMTSEKNVGEERRTDIGDESLCLDQAEAQIKEKDHPRVDTPERISMLSLSPSFVAESASATIETAQKLVVSPTSATVATPPFEASSGRATASMRRSQNFTHDGVLELDPDPQDIDPPRPTMKGRAGTDSQINGVEFGAGLRFDFGGRFTLGFGKVTTDVNFEEGSVGPDGVELGDVKSALDRLMDDVAGTNVSDKRRRREVKEGDESMGTDLDDSFAASPTSQTESPVRARAQTMVAQPIERTTTDLALGPGKGLSRTVSDSSIAPPVPPKSQDARKERERLILEKRRQMRKMEEDMACVTPPRLEVDIDSKKGNGRPTRRRSRSTGDVRNGEVQDLAIGLGDLGNSIEKELRKLERGIGKGKYRVREREATIYASSSHDDVGQRQDGDNIGHVSSAGDLDGGRAWRMLRRPSDMNEYSRQIRELRAQERQGKAHGKVFVRVLCMKGVALPLPQQTTAVTCTLNNGIHFVTTPECQLTPNCRIDQEFELIEHSKLEFTLTIKVRRDTHIISQFKALATPPAAVQPSVPASKGGMRNFFSSPKKATKSKSISASTTSAPAAIPDNLARYLKPDGTLARAFIAFKDIASHCDTKVFETSFPLIGQKMEAGGFFKSLEVGEIALQIFRLPPLSGIPQEKLPQSLDECQRGLRHTNWHKVTYFEGVLTQNGGDCTTWRRRHFRVIGANLVAYNDVTKKAITTIDLKKALAVQDDQEVRSEGVQRYTDEYDGLYGVERSFRLTFSRNQEIMFFSDTDEEKARWLSVFKALIGHVPPNPLWAELIWQLRDEVAKKPEVSEN